MSANDCRFRDNRADRGIPMRFDHRPIDKGLWTRRKVRRADHLAFLVLKTRKILVLRPFLVLAPGSAVSRLRFLHI